MKATKKYFLLSFCINCLILSGMLSAQDDKQVLISQTTVTDLVNTYIYHASSHVRPVFNKSGVHHARKPVAEKINTVLSGHKNNKQSITPILKLLHAAIAAHQIYPEEAVELNQKGQVKIGFELEPSGMLNRITLLKSSGYASIDAAALAAVQAISPFTETFVPTKETFSVEVVFA